MIYLNYAALCPTHPEAEREVEGTLAEFKQYLYSDAGIQWYLQKSQRCREKVGKLLNAQDPSTIAFVPNASTANSLVLSSLVWNPGDAIVTSTHENPSIIRELRTLAQRGVQTHTVKPTSASEFVTAIARLTATLPSGDAPTINRRSNICRACKDRDLANQKPSLISAFTEISILWK